MRRGPITQITDAKGNKTFSYDGLNGLTEEQTPQGDVTYTYDNPNRLTQITQGNSAVGFAYGKRRTTLTLPNGMTMAYAGACPGRSRRNALGRRMSKTINGVTTQFLYDGLKPVQELDGANPPAVTSNLLTGLGIDEYFARTDSNGTLAFARDALGSTVGLVNSAGLIDTSYTYEPFGNTSISGSSANAFQFTGRENDGTGLYFYRARYYSPTLQRFVSQDLLENRGDANLYAYVYDDPISLEDPSGLFPSWLSIAIPVTVSTFNADPCPLGRFLAMVLGSGGSRIGAMFGEIGGAGAGFTLGKVIEPAGGGFPGAFVGGTVGWGVGFTGGLVSGNLLGGFAGDKLGAAFGMPGCNPNTPCGHRDDG